MRWLPLLFLIIVAGCDSPLSNQTEDLPILSDIVDLSCGYRHCCALRNTGKTYCWGSRGGNGFNEDLYYAVAINTDLPGFNVETGRDSSCTLASDQQTLTCWLLEDETEGPKHPYHAPQSFLMPYRIIDFDIQDSYSPADYLHYLTADGRIYSQSLPLTGEPQFEVESNGYQLETGKGHVCYLLKTGETYCWGDNQAGELIGSDQEKSDIPIQILPFFEVTKLSIGEHYSCIITLDQIMFCWGELYDSYDPSNGYHEIKQNSIADISVGSHYACMVNLDHQVFCWGLNDYNTITQSTWQKYYTPTPICMNEGCTQKLKSVRSLAAGSMHICAIMIQEEIDGNIYHNTVRCWGDNLSGQLGINSSDIGSSAIPLHVRFEE